MTGCRIIWLDSIDSTNSEVKRNIDMLDNLTAIAAYEQTSGRGQRGNTWLTESGKNLTFSILIKYEEMQVIFKALNQFTISEITALSVVELLSGYGIDAMIKWPNDIYVDDRKICGILIEHSLKGESLSHSIVGIGLNVNQTVFDPSLPNPTSMRSCLPDSAERLDPAELSEQFMGIFYRYLQRIFAGDSVRDLYLARLWKSGIESRFIDYTAEDSREFTGCIRGITEAGKLLIEDSETQQLWDFWFKEVGFV